MSRFPTLLLAAALVVVPACAYESSGTTTTVTAAPEDTPPPSAPAEIVALDQQIEGSSVLVESVSLPSPGFVVVRRDAGGSPGEVIGISELISTGVISRVPVPFFLPIVEETTVHLTVHIDMDRDERFTYEPPDSFVDEIATTAAGDPATTTALLTLLAPLSPADVFVDPQTNNGTTLDVASASLPSPGWVAVHQSEGGEPGVVLAISDLLPAGITTGLVFDLDPALASTQSVFVAVWIDRDQDGIFDPEDGLDEIGVRDTGALALENPVITVLSRSPGDLFVLDQESDGTSITLDSVQFPAPGFVEILSDDDGAPGTRLTVSDLIQAGVFPDLEVEFEEALTESAVLWVRLWIDFDQDGTLSDEDLTVLDEPDGDRIQDSFEVTIE
ncbi:MAG: hypothetical protein WD184_08845 [Acidimicrobiia bacterium]